MEIRPVAIFRSPLSEKFGVPRQSGLAPSLRGVVELIPPYNRPEALKGLDGFDFIWLVWQFNLASPSDSLTVRPPRLGGNERVGVFASRSPFRPNSMGLSSVRVEAVDEAGCRIEVIGADLADGTPIFDIKPYVEYADSHPGVRSGFVDAREWAPLELRWEDGVRDTLSPEDAASVGELLSLDPRPAYQDDPERIYGLTYGCYNIRFSVVGGIVSVLSVEVVSGKRK